MELEFWVVRGVVPNVRTSAWGLRMVVAGEVVSVGAPAVVGVVDPNVGAGLFRTGLVFGAGSGPCRPKKIKSPTMTTHPASVK